MRQHKLVYHLWLPIIMGNVIYTNLKLDSHLPPWRRHFLIQRNVTSLSKHVRQLPLECFLNEPLCVELISACDVSVDPRGCTSCWTLHSNLHFECIQTLGLRRPEAQRALSTVCPCTPSLAREAGPAASVFRATWMWGGGKGSARGRGPVTLDFFSSGFRAYLTAF